MEVIDATKANKNDYLDFLAALCETKITTELGIPYWDINIIKVICGKFGEVVKPFVNAPCTKELGMMEQNMRVGLVVFDVFCMIKEKHRIFDPGDLITIDGNEYAITDDKYNPLTGNGPKAGMPLSALRAMTGGYKRSIPNRDMIFVSVMNFAGGMDNPIIDEEGL